MSRASPRACTRKRAAAGVHVTALCPGLTHTEFQRVSNTQRYSDKYPAIAWTTPDLVVKTGLADVIANKAVSVPGAQYKVLSATHELGAALAAQASLGLGATQLTAPVTCSRWR